MSEYVTNEAWARTASRADAIDDVADQFERREPASSRPGEQAPEAADGRRPRAVRRRPPGPRHARADRERLAAG